VNSNENNNDSMDEDIVRYEDSFGELSDINNDKVKNIYSHRRSSRVKAAPYRFDPNAFVSIALDIPMTYTEALESSEKLKWNEAINEELYAHHKNGTWVTVKRNDNMNVIGCKWVFTKKRDSYGNVCRYKARLVAKGFNQQYGIDYTETFAPVLKYKSLRIILVLSVIYQTELEQLDVKTAFLNASVSEDIYVSIPEGMNMNEDYVLKLKKALYGIKQAPREWNQEITKFLLNLGYVACKKDACLYIKISKNNNIIVVGLFVDDMLVLYFRNDRDEWKNDKRKLKEKYDLTEMGQVKQILGMRVTKLNNNSLMLDQALYVNDKLKMFGFDNAKHVSTPEVEMRKMIGTKIMRDDSIYESDNNESDLSDSEINTCRVEIGSLIYASVSTRPDITHATNIVSRYMTNPTKMSVVMIKRILRYLAGVPHLGLIYDNKSNNSDGEVIISGYCDADWGGDLVDRKSTTGYCTFINNNLISWNSKKQRTVALSSTEAEYMAINEVAKELMWLRIILKEMNVKVKTPSILYVDNQSAIKISENDTEHDRTKHIDIRYYFIRDLISSGEMKLRWVSTGEQLADIFTKPLGGTIFTNLRDILMKNNQQ
jgi:hypothetical protein